MGSWGRGRCTASLSNVKLGPGHSFSWIFQLFQTFACGDLFMGSNLAHLLRFGGWGGCQGGRTPPPEEMVGALGKDNWKMVGSFLGGSRTTFTSKVRVRCRLAVQEAPLEVTFPPHQTAWRSGSAWLHSSDPDLLRLCLPHPCSSSQCSSPLRGPGRFLRRVRS